MRLAGFQARPQRKERALSYTIFWYHNGYATRDMDSNVGDAYVNYCRKHLEPGEGFIAVCANDPSLTQIVGRVSRLTGKEQT